MNTPLLLDTSGIADAWLRVMITEKLDRLLDEVVEAGLFASKG
ncbi:MAG: hypothetical protein QXW58_06040 [Thermosphaera sp.]